MSRFWRGEYERYMHTVRESGIQCQKYAAHVGAVVLSGRC